MKLDHAFKRYRVVCVLLEVEPKTPNLSQYTDKNATQKYPKFQGVMYCL